MKEIIFIRHAKVDIDNSEKISSYALKKWINTYNDAPIDKESLPTNELIVLAKNTDIVLTSTLRRSIDSAKVLRVEVFESNPLFNEAAIPEVTIPFLKLKPKSWLMILRVLLLLGLGKKDTSLKASKVQAEKAAQRLLTITDEFESVVLVGHGGMNWLIGKVLMNEGWELEGKASHANWGVTVLKQLKDKKF